jgi:hypothetical protein
MRPDRVIPVTSNPVGDVPLYGLGFGTSTLGNVRGEPTVSVPSLSLQTAIDRLANTPVTTSAAGQALADSESGTFTYALKEHWPWLVVGALAIAAVVWK